VRPCATRAARRPAARRRLRRRDGLRSGRLDSCRGRVSEGAGVSTVPGNRLRAILSRFDKARVVVVGDLVADEFIYGQIDRVSREAPVLILKYDSTEIVPGGAGNAAANAAALGADVQVIGAVGNDDAGSRLLDVLGRHVDVRAVIRAKKGVTTVKTRILAGGVHSAKQQVVRIDRAGLPVTAALAQQVESIV